jgi:hypothetical protein
VRWRRRAAPQTDGAWTWPYRGTLVWLTSEEGGRQSGPARPTSERDFYATTAFVPPHTSGTTQATFVLRGFDPGRMSSPAEARWLMPGLGEFQTIEPGTIVVVTEGSRTVARFHVEAVDEAVDEA